MGNLIKAEFRKVITTGLWWGMLIPTVLLALAWALMFGWFGAGFIDGMTSDQQSAQMIKMLGLEPERWQLGLFGMSRSINVATIFPMLFGGLAIASEMYHKTITTTFLTAPNRATAIGAKVVVYAGFGVLYGVAIAAATSIGIAIGADGPMLPGPGGWLAVCAVGVLLTVLMTLFGVGVGALLRHPVASTLVLLLYVLLIENVIWIGTANSLPNLIAFLPNGSANGITGSVAADIFLSSLNLTGTENLEPFAITSGELVRTLSGSTGSVSWWLSSLIFFGWTLLFAGIGSYLTQRRDVT